MERSDIMRGGFTKGLIVGSIIGASMGIMMDNGNMKKSRKRMMRNGRNVLKSSSDIVSDVIRMFR